MKLFDIEAFFSKFIRVQIKHRMKILIAMLLLAFISMFGLTKLRIISESGILGASEEQKEAEKRFNDIFSSDSILVLVTSDDVFKKEVLYAIEELGSRLERELPAVDNVYSLRTMAIPIGSADDIKIRNPFDERGGIPDDPTELEKIKQFFLSRESLVNLFVSDDAKETWIMLPIRPIDDDQLNRERQAQSIILEEAEKFADVCTMYPVGGTYSEMESRIFSRNEAIIRLLIGFVVMLLVLTFFIRSFVGVVIPVITTIFGIGTVIGISSYIGIAADIEAVSLPIILGMALSVGYSIHVINAFKMNFRRTGKRKESVYAAIEETGWSILFTVITTVASLISFLFFDISILHWIGGTSACIVLSVYVYVVILIPIMMSFGKDGVPDTTYSPEGATLSDMRFGSFGGIISNRRVIVTIISMVILAIMVPGIMRITINMDMLEMQGPKVPHIARLMKLLDCKLGAIFSYDLMIEYDDPDAFKDVDKLLKLDELHKRAGQLDLVRKSGGKPRVRSACDMLKEINRMFNEDDPAYYTINTEEGVAAQNLTFYADNFASFFDVDNDNFGITRLHIDILKFDSKNMLANATQIKHDAQELFPDAHIYTIGTILDYARTNETLISVEMKSIMYSFLIITILMIIAFSSVSTGLIAMIPNIAPVIIIAGFMGFMGKSLDILTVTVMPMVLGLAVDDTIHLTNQIKAEFKRTGSYHDSVVISFREIGKTMCMTSIILCAMFAVYLTSPLRFFVHTGLLSIIGISSALIADYTLTPALICIVKPFGKEKK